MKKYMIHTVVRNYSRYPIDVVWENAQDLEHVAVLHGKTNKDFELLYTKKLDGSKFVYDLLAYRATRKLFGFLGFQSFGLRQIIKDYNLYQIECIPLFGTTSALNSMLFKSDDPEFPTLMVDEIVMEVPRFMMPFRKKITDSLHRHARIQCREDEPFRERRVLLKEKGIDLPFRLFNESAWDRICSQFSHNAVQPKSEAEK